MQKSVPDCLSDILDLFLLLPSRIDTIPKNDQPLNVRLSFVININ